MGDHFRARSTSERRVDQCPGSNRHRWIKKLNLSPNISATPSHLPNSATDTASVARPATNGSIAIRQRDRLDWPHRSRRPHSSPDETPELLRLAIIEARRRHRVQFSPDVLSSGIPHHLAPEALPLGG